jgi:hypothetical protein
MLPDGQHTAILLFVMEHVLIIFKGYLTSTIPLFSIGSQQHKDKMKELFSLRRESHA